MEEKKGVSGSQKVETQTEDHPEDQGNTTLDGDTNDVPLVVDNSTTLEIQQVDTAPSGHSGVKHKGDEGEKKDTKTKEAKVTQVDKGKGVGIFTPLVTGTPP